MVGAVVSSPRATWLGAIAACLQGIKKVDGYNTDAGLTVTLEPLAPVAFIPPTPTLPCARA